MLDADRADLDLVTIASQDLCDLVSPVADAFDDVGPVRQEPAEFASVRKWKNHRQPTGLGQFEDQLKVL